MNVEQIRNRLHEDPNPFVIRLTDGRRFPVRHQDYMALGAHSVFIVDDDDNTVRIDPLQIVSLDDVRRKNGRNSI